MNERDECRRPNFFLIGAAKCGTTSVANYLDQHPDVFVSKPKEPNFFSFEPGTKPSCKGPADSEQLYELLLKYSVTSPTDYEALFARAGESHAAGEASVRYLYESHTAARIAEYAPEAKLIVILRNPIDRMHSHYHMNVRQHIELETFADAIAAEDERVESGWGWDWHYFRVGQYAEQLERYYQCFDRSRVLILFQNDLQMQPLETMQAIFRHLQVSDKFEPNFTKRALVGHTPRWRGLRQVIRDENPIKTVARHIVPRPARKAFVRWTESKNRMAIPAIDADLQQQLIASYAESNEHLADLLKRRLPW